MTGRKATGIQYGKVKSTVPFMHSNFLSGKIACYSFYAYVCADSPVECLSWHLKHSQPPSTSHMFCWFMTETGFDIITPDELKDRKVKDPSWGVDLVIDCSGYAPAIEQALVLINPGGKMCIFGVTSPEARIR